MRQARFTIRGKVWALAGLVGAVAWVGLVFGLVAILLRLA